MVAANAYPVAWLAAVKGVGTPIGGSFVLLNDRLTGDSSIGASILRVASVEVPGPPVQRLRSRGGMAADEVALGVAVLGDVALPGPVRCGLGTAEVRVADPAATPLSSSSMGNSRCA